MKVVDFAKQLGIPATKIRYYDKIGLIQGKRNEENNYRELCNNDALNIYHALMLSSFGMSVDECKESKAKDLEALNQWTDAYIVELEEKIRFEHMMQSRLREMQVYYQILNHHENQFAPLLLDDQWMVWNLGNTVQLNKQQLESIEILANCMPFSFMAIKIDKKSLFSTTQEVLNVQTGLGILKHNALKLKLDLPQYEVYLANETVQYVFETENPFEITKAQMQPLIDYIEVNHLPHQDITGRIVLSYMKDGKFKHGIMVSVQGNQCK